ncbi:MAG TPA: IPT/TIG domain-containing protein [Vulgatibacter sp.]
MRLGIRWAVLSLAAASLLALGCGDDPSGSVGGTGGGNPPITGRAGSGGDGGSGGGEGGAGGAGGETSSGSVHLEAVRPPRGSQAGGETVILMGSGFLGTRDFMPRINVTFGSNPSIGARVIDDHTIYATVPPGSAGTADVKLEVENAGWSICKACYRYLLPAAVSRIEPSSGSLYGGGEVWLRGSGLHEGLTVVFGGRAALDPTLEEDGSLRVIVPPGDAAGSVDVRIFDAAGQAFLRKAFEYVDRLRIASIDPPGGPLSGGNPIVVTGTGFTSGATLRVDGAEVEAQVVSSTELTALLPPAMSPGAVELSVTTPQGTATVHYAYFDPADDSVRVYAVSPERGSAAGGEKVVLAGTGLDGDRLAVKFGSSLAIPSQSDGPHYVRATTPAAGTPGLADVEARVATGADLLAAGFRYANPISVGAVSPASGPIDGGTAIQVSGSGFPAGARLFVGALEATSVVRVSDTLITAVTPRGTDGPVPVRVEDPADPDALGVLRGAFRYEGVFSLALVEPAMGARAGGTRVTLRGTGFHDEMKVTFGAGEATIDEVPDPFTAIVLSPRGNTGVVDVSAWEDEVTTLTLPGAYTYVDPTSTSGGSSGGPLNGNLNITALDGGRGNFGMPLEGALVVLGGEDGSGLEARTDDRGQVTLSSPLLVKPQTVTVFMPEYQAATVVQQRSENLTVLLQPTGGEPSPPPPPPPVGILTGKVFGFKRPPTRELQENEVEVAKVSIAAPNIWRAPPFDDPAPEFLVGAEGEEYGFQFTGSGFVTVYATYGILNTETGEFEKLLLGVTRGAKVVAEETHTADIILDTRLDLHVPITLDNPPSFRGAVGSTDVYGFLDLGGDGVIPVGEARSFGATGSSAQMNGLPNLSGESFLFEAWGTVLGGAPLSVTYRRQSGDLSQGLTIGPFMGVPMLTQPAFIFDGTIAWETEPGPAPEITSISIDVPDMARTPVWHMVLPGNESRITLPPSVMDEIRAIHPPGSMLILTLMQGREPRFGYDQWSYIDTYINAWTSFTYFGTFIQL